LRSALPRCKRRAMVRHAGCIEPLPIGPRYGRREMPEGMSKKRERQYEHIKESYKDSGVSTDEAEERAARTVNKERREKGETKTRKKS
jgi:hypothetical protein